MSNGCSATVAAHAAAPPAAAERRNEVSRTVTERDGSQEVFNGDRVAPARASASVASGAAYAASKGAVHALIKNIARNNANQGIYANAVAPGPVSGTMWGEVIHGGNPPDPASWVPTERFGTPSDIAQAIVYLASPQSNWVTGQVLDVKDVPPKDAPSAFARLFNFCN